MIRLSSVLKILLFIFPLVYVFYLGLHQVLFEQFLNTRYITFHHFQPEYAQALLASVPDSELLNFNYSSSFSSSLLNIPTTIHFVWFKNLYETHERGSDIPSVGTNSPDRCRLTNPGFTIHIWNATNARELLQTNYAWFLPTYDGYKYPIQRVDAFKYFVLWHYGGVYMDLDVSCRRPLQPLLEFPAWFPRAHPVGVGNDLMAARPQHPVMGKILQELIPHDLNLLFPYITVFWSTGPQFTSNVLKSWFNDNHNKNKYSQNLTKTRSGRLKASKLSCLCHCVNILTYPLRSKFGLYLA